MTKITAFHELRKPMKTCDGKWYAAACYSVVKFLDARGEIVSLTFGQSNTEIYFNSEIEVHTAAAAYYIKNGKKYPHFDFWHNNAKDVITTQPIESEPMDFS